MFHRVFLLGLVFLSVVSEATQFTIECKKKGELILVRAETALKKAEDGTFVASYLLEYEGKKPYTRQLKHLQCDFESPAVHCWNEKGQAFNWSEHLISKFNYDDSAPEKFSPAKIKEFRSTFMFHPRPWAESGPDADKFQHLSYGGSDCTFVVGL